MESETGFYFSTNKVKKQLGIREGKGKRAEQHAEEVRKSDQLNRAKGVKGGTSSLFVFPLQGQGTASFVGFGATPQLFFGRPIPRKPPTKAQAAKRPCQ